MLVATHLRELRARARSGRTAELAVDQHVVALRDPLQRPFADRGVPECDREGEEALDPPPERRA
jgi:hypothetical protein